MFGFNYYTPTKVVFGKGTESRVAELVREFGGKKVLIHYGSGSVIRSGLLQRLRMRWKRPASRTSRWAARALPPYGEAGRAMSARNACPGSNALPSM